MVNTKSGRFPRNNRAINSSLIPIPQLNDRASRYYEACDFEEKIINDIMAANTAEPAKAFSVFSVKICRLERVLYDFWTAIQRLCTQQNTIAYMKKPSLKEAKVWTDRDGSVKNFTQLSLGQKHQRLLMVVFLNESDKKAYEKTLAKLSNLVTDRNKIVHRLFSFEQEVSAKTELLERAIIRCDRVFKHIDRLDDEIEKYILLNMRRYIARD